MLEQWELEAPELDRSAMGVIGRIKRLASLLQADVEALLADHDLNGGEFDVLAALRRGGQPYRLTPTDLCRASMVTSGGMTKRLTALESRGLVRRDPDPNDGRSTTVSLTPAGERLVDEVLPELVANEERMLSDLAPGDRESLARLLAELALSLGDDADRRGRRRRTQDS